jgi:hypothetical protein
VALGKSNEGTKTIFGGGNSFVQSAESPVRPLFGATSQITVADAKTVNLKEEDAAVLDCSSGVSFAALAANVSTEAPPAFVKDKNGKWSKCWRIFLMWSFFRFQQDTFRLSGCRCPGLWLAW